MRLVICATILPVATNIAATTMTNTLPDNEPTRKQRFDAALKLGGLTLREWSTAHYDVDPSYLHRVLTAEVPGGAELNAAIDATITKYLVAPAPAQPVAAAR